MTQKGVERFLSVLYISSIVTSMTSMICVATVWQYWTMILDVCVNIDCGCVLYTKSVFGVLGGGSGRICQFGVYGLVPTVLLDICLAGYHGYRSCIKKHLNVPVRTYNNDDDSREFGMREPSRAEDNRRHILTPYQRWMPFVCLAILLSCLSLSHAILLTDGFHKSCEYYRIEVIQVLGSTGREAQVIRNRLSCGAIFDFIDYLQPSNTTWERAKPPDTGVVLQLAIATTWYNFISWMIAFMLYYIMARRKLCFF